MVVVIGDWWWLWLVVGGGGWWWWWLLVVVVPWRLLPRHADAPWLVVVVVVVGARWCQMVPAEEVQTPAPKLRRIALDAPSGEKEIQKVPAEASTPGKAQCAQQLGLPAPY